MEEIGRHFLLHVLKFVFGIVGRRPLPKNIQSLLSRYPPDAKSPFAGKIVDALIISITDYVDRVDDLPEISSKQFRDELNSIASDENFLRFVGRYSVKVLSEYCNWNDSSHSLFLDQVTDFLKNLQIEESRIPDFLANWNKGAENILKESEAWNHFHRNDPNFIIDLCNEKSFLIDAMNWVFEVFNARPEIMLRRETPENLLSINTRNALRLAVHHNQQFLTICDYEQLKAYFHRRCINNFDFKHFLELCACCTANVVFKNTCVHDSQDACDFLLLVLKHARKVNKFTSFEEILIAANELIDIYQVLYNKDFYVCH